MQNQTVPSFTIFDDYRPIVSVAVVVRWVLLLAWLAMIHYRLDDRGSSWVALNIMAIGLAALNAYMTIQILRRQPITWRHGLALSIGDLSIITVGLFIRGGFQNDFFVFYYPAMLGISLMFPRRVSFGMLAIIMALYVIMALTISPTLNTERAQEKLLFVRLIVMAGIVVAGTLITSWERTRRREAVAAERERADENLELQRKAQLAELAAVEERSRIAREIHDGIAQSIYMLSLNLETCADMAEPQSKPVEDNQHQKLRERLGNLVELSKETLLEVRHYIFDLKPYLAGEKGMVSMVENQVREFNNVARVPTNLETKGEERSVPVSVATCLYRVTQEALANAFKHAGASHVNVSLEFAHDMVELTVQDDGRGFDVTTPNSGHGLHNIPQRAEELGGTFDLNSAPGGGTKVVIRLPC